VIDWEDSSKRKAFREALQQVYSSAAELRLFVDEELGENLEVVASGDNLKVISYNLIVWAFPIRINELYTAFKNENPNHSVIQKIEQQSLIPQSSNLSQADWNDLFGQFLPDDVADAQRAFFHSYQSVFGNSFRDVRPEYPSLTTLEQIRELLELNDRSKNGPVLAVRFVEFTIVEIQRSHDSNRGVMALQSWCDRIAQQFGIPARVPEPDRSRSCHAYLLIVLEEIGADVNVYPELHITGLETPIQFGATPITCPIAKVADQLSKWILQAENILVDETCDDSEVTLEVFLPCQYLEEDIATTWILRDKRDDEIEFGTYRRFLVRSSDRMHDRQIQKALNLTWKKLENSERAGSACSQFHRQADCPDKKGVLGARIKDHSATGLKLLAPLPTDRDKRTGLLNEIIDSAIPIALWTSATADVDPHVL